MPRSNERGSLQNSMSVKKRSEMKMTISTNKELPLKADTDGETAVDSQASKASILSSECDTTGVK